MERRSHIGLTLLELLIAMTVAAVLASVAVPAFASLIRHTQLVAATNELFTALYLARTEAVKRGGRVSLCKSADGAACTRAGGYEQGWIVFEDPNADGVRADDEALIAGRDALGRAAVSGNRPVAHYVSYNAMGATRTASGALQMGTLTVCVGSDARRIVVSRAGRPRVEPGDC